MGVTHLLSQAVSYGMLIDHLPIFEYILRTKAARGQRIKAVLLLIDLDFSASSRGRTATSTVFFRREPTGESPVRYRWRYLTAFQCRPVVFLPSSRSISTH
jgi:hypothetical protein